MNRYEVKFQYADAYSNWSWRNQQCMVYGNSEAEAISKCKDLYGLGIDCEYKIISATQIN